MRQVIIELQEGSTSRNRSVFLNMPVAQTIEITVYSDSDPNAANLASDIDFAIRQELGNLGTMQGGSFAPPPRRVLIFVADGSGSIDAAVQTKFSSRGCTIVPVVDAAVAGGAPACLPAFMQTVLAETTAGWNAGPIVPRLLRAAGIVDAAVRLFISYRHADAEAVAIQLFGELEARGFQPFLDRFRSQPGDDFVELIEEELADKACLISLETPNIGQSLYCRQEVATAVARRMGMIAVDLPGSVGTFPAIRRRIDMTKSGVNGAQATLGAAELNVVADKIERYYPHEARRRPRWQDLTLRAALRAAGKTFAADGLGICLADMTAGGRILLGMSPSLPPVRQFVEVEARRTAWGVGAATILGPVRAARRNRLEELQWLARLSNIDLKDEGGLARYVASL